MIGAFGDRVWNRLQTVGANRLTVWSNLSVCKLKDWFANNKVQAV
jgi:hypothetical protein